MTHLLDQNRGNIEMKTFLRWLHENAKLIFAIAVIFHSVLKTLWKHVVHNIWVRKGPDIKILFRKYLETSLKFFIEIFL